MQGIAQEPEVPREKEIILKFVTGTQRMPEESPEVGIRPAARSFGDI